MPYKNPEQKKANSHSWYEANKEKVKAAAAVWVSANREKVVERSRRRYAADPEKARAYQRQYYAKHRRAQARADNLKRKFGFTVEQHELLFASQNYQCASCGKDDPGTKTGWHTDHDHANGKVRGILCHGCNIALGSVKDNPDTLRKLACYVERHRA